MFGFSSSWSCSQILRNKAIYCPAAWTNAGCRKYWVLALVQTPDWLIVIGLWRQWWDLEDKEEIQVQTADITNTKFCKHECKSCMVTWQILSRFCSVACYDWGSVSLICMTGWYFSACWICDLLDLWNTLKNVLHLLTFSIIDPELGYLAKFYFFAQLQCIPTHIPNDWIQNIIQDLDSPGRPLSKTHLGKILAKSRTWLN